MNAFIDIDGYLDKRGAWHQGHGADWANYLPQETAGYLLCARTGARCSRTLSRGFQLRNVA